MYEKLTESFEKKRKLYVIYIIATAYSLHALLQSAVTCTCLAPKCIMTYITLIRSSPSPSARGDVGRKSGESLLYIMQMRGTKFWTEILSSPSLLSFLVFLTLFFPPLRVDSLSLLSFSSFFVLSSLVSSVLPSPLADRDQSRDASR